MPSRDSQNTKNIYKKDDQRKSHNKDTNSKKYIFIHLNTPKSTNVLLGHVLVVHADAAAQRANQPVVLAPLRDLPLQAVEPERHVRIGHAVLLHHEREAFVDVRVDLETLAGGRRGGRRGGERKKGEVDDMSTMHTNI